jgi:hypothetical protein
LLHAIGPVVALLTFLPVVTPSANAVSAPPAGGNVFYSNGEFEADCSAALQSTSAGMPTTAQYRLTVAAALNPLNLLGTVGAGAAYRLNFARCYLPNGQGQVSTTLAKTGTGSQTFSAVTLQLRLCLEVSWSDDIIGLPWADHDQVVCRTS